MITLTEMICYTLKKAPWLNNEGFDKGLHHDRQQLGIILSANTPLKIRQLDTRYGAATLRLLCDDSAVEKSLTLKPEWQTISATVDTVPFIDTLFTEDAQKFYVEFEQTVEPRELPFFNREKNATVFFSSWAKTQASFALVDTGSAQLLVPYADMDNLQKVNTENGISGLLNFYEEIFAFYNKLAGLSFTPENPLNQNIGNKYFIKADKHGIGAAYYGSYWCAETSSTIAQGWIDNAATQWTILHEIAHGYQGKFMNDSRFSVGEVWNNIYGAWFQQTTLGNANQLYTQGWLYNYGKKDAVEKNLRNNIASKTPANKWDLRSKLLLLMLMQFKSSTKSFTLFNEEYRALANREDFLASNYHTLDIMADASATVAGYDMTAWIDLCGIELNDVTRERIQAMAAKPVYPLYDLLPEAEWANAQKKLGLPTSVWLVDNAELSVLNKKGNVSFNINIDDLAQIYGHDIKLIDNCGTDITVRITDDVLQLQTLPVGIYQLILPKGRSQKYAVDKKWLVVREGENSVTVNYSPLYDTNSRNESLVFLGLADTQFATLTINNERKKIILDVTNSTPHSYYGADTYASVTIFTADGKQIFNRVMPGKNCPITCEEIPFEEGYLIDVYHAECGHRFYNKPTYIELISHYVKTNNFRIDNAGLVNIALNNNPNDDLRAIIAESAQQLRSEPLIYSLPDSAEKVNIWLMINQFADEARDTLALEYADCIPLDNSDPDNLTGSAIHLSLCGLGNYEFCGITIDNSRYQMTVTTKPVQPHAYYPKTYAWVRVWDEKGIEIYSRNYDGTVHCIAGTETLPLRDGYVIDIYHDEPFRCVASNTMQNTDIQLAQDNTWEVTRFGLKKCQHPGADALEPTLRGNKFLWKLLGYYDGKFASIDIDLVNNTLVYSTEAITPHSLYAGLYAEVRIIDNEGLVVYQQAIQAKEPLVKFTDTMTLAKGYTIEVYHAEAGHRSVIINAETEHTYQQKRKVVYNVIEKGLFLVSEE